MSKKIYEVTVFEHGREEWRLDGKRHRDNDLPAYIDGDYQEWYQHGKTHRDNDLPAVIEGKIQIWIKDGKRHRLTGPAFINGSYEEYYIEGKQYNKKYFDEKIKQMNRPSCEGKIVEIDGKKYQLKAM